MNRTYALRDPRFVYRRLPWLSISIVVFIAALMGALCQRPDPNPYAPNDRKLIAWLWYPIERNPHVRLPFVSSHLRSVTFTDDRTGWAVAYNMLLKTENGGDSWTPITNDAWGGLQSVAFAADGVTGWVVGENGTILKTENAGNTWQSITTGTPYDFVSIALIGAGQTALAIGTSGELQPRSTILRTLDGGETWASVMTLTGDRLQSIAFADHGTTVCAVGDNGKIIITRNSGRTWTVAEVHTSSRLNAVSFAADNATGFAVGANGTILKTVNGGETWMALATGSEEWLESVAVAPDGATAWAVGAQGTILKTDDAGETWAPQVSGTPTRLTDVTLLAKATKAIVVGNNGTVLKTKNGGKTWTPQTRGISTDFESAALFGDGTTGILVGGNGTILTTRNAGRTWMPRTSGTRSNLESVTAARTHEPLAWAVGSNGTILTTEDSGASWRPLTSGTANRLVSVTFSRDNTTGWAVGWSGTMLKTNDGGATWDNRTTGRSEHLMSVTFSSDGKTAWAVGGIDVLKIEDGSEIWRPQQRENGQLVVLESVTFARDNRTGWAVGANGRIIKTQDAGETWQRRESGTLEFLQSVDMSDNGTTGLAVGRNGTILRTEDGGETWLPISSPKHASLNSVTLSPDGNIGLAVGHDTILVTDDAGNSWHAVTTNDYRKRPAPWTWVAMFLGLLPIIPASRPLSGARRTGVADDFVSDQPIADARLDTLGRAPIVEALSAFLRNHNTQPPLTIAITGDWGQGKTSMMKLLQADLERRRNKTVWFNAWHHQKERHLFAALMQTIRDQMRRGDVPFHVRLALLRARRHPVWTAIVIALFTFSATALLVALQSSTQTTQPADSIWNLGSSQTSVISRYLPSVFTGAISIAILLRAAFATMRGVYPKRLLRLSRGVFLPNTFGDQLSFRHRFSTSFQEVATAMKPFKGLIFIDDLDRCRPDQVVEILEAVNFLVNAAPCYIIMGIAPAQVIRSIGLEFRDIAYDMASIDSRCSDALANVTPDSERQSRWAYARNYLGKIVNIEVPVPTLTDAQAEALTNLANSDDQTLIFASGRREVLKKMLITTALAVTAATFGIFGFFAANTAPIMTASMGSLFGPSRSAPPEPSREDASQDDVGGLTPATDQSKPIGVTVSKTNIRPPEGSSDDYTIVLDTKPRDSVQIVLGTTGTDDDFVFGHRSPIVFTTSDWSSKQTVTVLAGQDDDSVDGTTRIRHLAVSADPDYNDFPIADVVATESDDDRSTGYSRGEASVEPGAEVPIPWWVYPICFVFVGLAPGLAILAYVRRREEDHTRDSPEFSCALSIWHPVLRTRANSPRELKRFVNRVRYLVSLSCVPREPRTDGLSESLIVALAAMQALGDDPVSPYGDNSSTSCIVRAFSDATIESGSSAEELGLWADGILDGFGNELAQRDRDGLRERLVTNFAKAIADHRSRFPGDRITREQMQKFFRLAANIVVR